MSISGLVVRTRPEQAAMIAEKISAEDGVEVHARTENGRLIVTVDKTDDRAAADAFDEIQNVDGVLNASLVYTRFEQDLADKELEQ
jgi:periplasmic nitrate reductase NapD